MYRGAQERTVAETVAVQSTTREQEGNSNPRRPCKTVMRDARIEIDASTT